MTNIHAQLTALLTEAAEIEHGVMCQYLFAAFSMKKHPHEGGVTWPQLEMMRAWEADILRIARQEMEHLGLVCNLLTAIGESPHFGRPNFPRRSAYYPFHIPFTLESLSLDTLARFICLERPEYLPGELPPPEVAFCMGEKSQQTIGDLYRSIKALFQTADERLLFIGPRSAQVANGDLVGAPTQNPGTPRGVYEIQLSPIIGKASAVQAIEQIIEEGEGQGGHENDSHFHLFLNIYREFTRERRRDAGFQPARPVLSNPIAVPPWDFLDGHEPTDGPQWSLLTHPYTRAIAKIFDLAYHILLLLLIRLYAHTDETADELAGLELTAFMPMMTAVIRPLGELLTQLPAYDGRSEPTAGAYFYSPRSLHLLPHREAAWQVLHGQLEALTEALRQSMLDNNAFFASLPSEVLRQEIRDRLTLTYENVARITKNFAGRMKSGGQA